MFQLARYAIPFRNDAVMGVRFAGRNTGIVVAADSRSEAIAKAKKRKKRGGDRVEEVWTLTPAQQAKANKGEWVRTVGTDERHLASEGNRGRGPKPKGYKTDSLFNLSRYAIAYNEDARQAPKTKGKTPGQPCGGGWISASYNCSPDKVKAAAKRLKSEEGRAAKARFTDRMRKAKGKSTGPRDKQQSERFAKAIAPKESTQKQPETKPKRSPEEIEKGKQLLAARLETQKKRMRATATKPNQRAFGAGFKAAKKVSAKPESAIAQIKRPNKVKTTSRSGSGDGSFKIGDRTLFRRGGRAFSIDSAG